MHKQNALFQYFSDTFDHLIEVDKKEGKYDMGILGECHQGRGKGLKEPTASTHTPGPHQEHQGPREPCTNKAFIHKFYRA